MGAITITAAGQLTLPQQVCRRWGLTQDTEVDLIEEADGLRLVMKPKVSSGSISTYAGMLTARPSGQPRCLDDFDPAQLWH